MSPNVALPNTKSNITGRIDIRQRVSLYFKKSE